VVVADAGMLSAANLNRLEDAGFGFIVGSRTSSAPYDLAEHYATVGNIVTDGETVETTRTMGAGVNARAASGVAVLPQAEDPRQHHVEQADRTRRADRRRHPPGEEGPVRHPRHQARRELGKSREGREYIGLKGYVTNLSTATASAAEIVAAYHDLFQVEATFRMAKTDLRARPMFASTADSIHAHLTVVFCALAISRHLYKTTGVTVRRIVRALRPLRDVTITIDGHELTATTPPTEAAIIAALRPGVGHAI
jgi:transposase